MTIETLSKQTIEIQETDLAARLAVHGELAQYADAHPGVRSTADVKSFAAAAHELMEIHSGLATDDPTLTAHQRMRCLLDAGRLWWHAGSNIGQRDAAQALLAYVRSLGQPVPENMLTYRAIRAQMVPELPKRRLLQAIGFGRRAA